VRVFSPMGRPPADPAQDRLARRLSSLRSRKVVFVDNGWVALDTLFSSVASRLESRWQATVAAHVESHERISPDVCGELASVAEAAVVGLGN
jgi:hypothetical protein